MKLPPLANGDIWEHTMTRCPLHRWTDGRWSADEKPIDSSLLVKASLSICPLVGQWYYHVGVKLHEAIGRAVGKELMCARFLSVSIFIFVFGGLCMLIQILKKVLNRFEKLFFYKGRYGPKE